MTPLKFLKCEKHLFNKASKFTYPYGTPHFQFHSSSAVDCKVLEILICDQLPAAWVSQGRYQRQTSVATGNQNCFFNCPNPLVISKFTYEYESIKLAARPMHDLYLTKIQFYRDHYWLQNTELHFRKMTNLDKKLPKRTIM